VSQYDVLASSNATFRLLKNTGSTTEPTVRHAADDSQIL